MLTLSAAQAGTVLSSYLSCAFLWDREQETERDCDSPLRPPSSEYFPNLLIYLVLIRSKETYSSSKEISKIIETHEPF